MKSKLIIYTTSVLMGAVLIAGCNHKKPTESDIYRSLKQELESYPALKLTKVSVINGIGESDGTHTIQANIKITVVQSDDTVKFYKSIPDGVKRAQLADKEKIWLPTTEINGRITGFSEFPGKTEAEVNEIIAKKYGFDSWIDLARMSNEIGKYQHVAPAYSGYKINNTIGGQLAAKAIPCKDVDLEYCANSSYEYNSEISVNMIKTDNGWVINYNR